MKIAIWTHHPGDCLGEIINFLTHGKAQHAGFIRANGLIHEAYWPRVRDRVMTEKERRCLKVFRLEGITPEQEARLEKAFDDALKKQIRYSIGDLFRFLLNIPNRNHRRTFCSRYVMSALMENLPQELWPLQRCMAMDWISPRDLYVSPRLIPDTI